MKLSFYSDSLSFTALYSHSWTNFTSCFKLSDHLQALCKHDKPLCQWSDPIHQSVVSAGFCWKGWRWFVFLRQFVMISLGSKFLLCHHAWTSYRETGTELRFQQISIQCFCVCFLRKPQMWCRGNSSMSERYCPLTAACLGLSPTACLNISALCHCFFEISSTRCGRGRHVAKGHRSDAGPLLSANLSPLNSIIVIQDYVYDELATQFLHTHTDWWEAWMLRDKPCSIRELNDSFFRQKLKFLCMKTDFVDERN